MSRGTCFSHTQPGQALLHDRGWSAAFGNQVILWLKSSFQRLWRISCHRNIQDKSMAATGAAAFLSSRTAVFGIYRLLYSRPTAIISLQGKRAPCTDFLLCHFSDYYHIRFPITHDFAGFGVAFFTSIAFTVSFI